MALLARIPAMAAVAALIASGSDISRIEVLPQNPLLFGKGAQQRLTVLAHFEDGGVEDVTERAAFRSSNPEVAGVSSGGLIEARAFGGAPIRAGYGGAEDSTVALVQRADTEPPVTFGCDVLPVLTRVGCNGGNCHGAMNGQNGFKLSLFGDHPDDDYAMIVDGDGGRRLDLADPAARSWFPTVPGLGWWIWPSFAAAAIIFLREPYDVWKGGPVWKSYLDAASWLAGLALAS